MPTKPSEPGKQCRNCRFRDQDSMGPNCKPCIALGVLNYTLWQPRQDPDAVPECKAETRPWTDTKGDVSLREATEVVNPKALAGAKKPRIYSVFPRWIVSAVGRVMSVGAAKYGAFNYRDSSIACSTYEDAIERHLMLWFDGEDNDTETGVSHLASVIASCALLMDAQATGKLHDDRQKTGIVKAQLSALTDLLVTLPLPERKTS